MYWTPSTKQKSQDGAQMRGQLFKSKLQTMLGNRKTARSALNTSSFDDALGGKFLPHVHVSDKGISADGGDLTGNAGFSFTDEGASVSTPVGGVSVTSHGASASVNTPVFSGGVTVSSNGANVEGSVNTPLGGAGISAGTSGIEANGNVSQRTSPPHPAGAPPNHAS